MTITIEAFNNGLAKYIDRELADKTSGLMKWGIGLFGAVAVKKTAELISNNAEMLHSIGYLTEDGLIEIDKVYDDLIQVAKEKGAVTQHIAGLGDVRFSEGDIEALRRYIIG